MSDSLYELLEVSPNACPAVIKAAYRCLAQQYHPDKNIGDPAAVQRMSRINQAYSVLTDPLLRARYDRISKQDEPKQDDSVERRGKGFTLRPVDARTFKDRPRQRPFAFRSFA